MLFRDTLSELGHQAVEVEGAPREGQFAFPPGPLARVAIPGELDAVVVGVVEVDCLVGAVVGGAVDGPAVVQQALQGNGQITALRIVYGEVVEPGRAAGGGGPPALSHVFSPMWWW